MMQYTCNLVSQLNFKILALNQNKELYKKPLLALLSLQYHWFCQYRGYIWHKWLQLNPLTYHRPITSCLCWWAGVICIHVPSSLLGLTRRRKIVRLDFERSSFSSTAGIKRPRPGYEFEQQYEQCYSQLL